jgi:hypothetical protein
VRLPAPLSSAVPGARPPVEIGRDEARDLARAELADPIYRNEEPSLWERAVSWVLDRLAELFDAAARSGLAGRVWLLVLAGLLLLAGYVLVRRRALPARRLRSAAVLDDPSVTAAEHRRQADAAAAAGDWATAVTCRFRAAVREAEERTLLDPRPGRTADEAAAELAPVLARAGVPGAEATRSAALFDAVRFGGRSATAADHALVQRLADAVVRARAVDATAAR